MRHSLSYAFLPIFEAIAGVENFSGKAMQL